MLCFNFYAALLEGKIKNGTLFITGRQIIVFVSCGKFRG